MLGRRRVLAAMALSSLPLAARARDTPMREAVNLGQSAKANALPLVLLFSIKGCPFCEFVRRSYLLPMNREGLINAWQVSIDRKGSLTLFDGSELAPRIWANGLGLTQTPTVLIISAKGVPLAEPLVGVVSSEFYGAMLAQRLADAREAGKP